jgi:hypothetical protein
MISKEAVQKIKNWQDGHTGFTSEFINLYAKADGGNKFKLALGFPELVAAYEAWYNSPDESVFFSTLLGE